MIEDVQMLEDLLEDSGALFLEPRATFDRAIVGLVERPNLSVVCYDRHLVIQALVDESGMDIDEATEYYEFNIAAAWVGEGTPVFLERVLRDDDDGEDEA